ncbi:helix-turn-helix domain-containing protein [Kutzneria sp. NPDC051319]|uniref:winged helix-turn-helix transcriptional regulator n=1 Tax=Kutzneria sp. NPDC051319 TaxID=3155047 RepID=UPI00341D504D
MRKTDFSGNTCPIARTLGEVGDWWSLLILRDAFAGLRRFGEFQESLGCAKNILSARLSKLVEHDLLRRVPGSDGSAYQEYELTDKGRDLRLVLVALRQFGENHLFGDGEEWFSLVDVRDGEPVAPLEMRASDGRLLRADDVEVRTVRRNSTS